MSIGENRPLSSLGVSPTDQQILGKSLILGSLLLGGGELKLLSLECRTALGAAKRVNPFELAPTHPITKSTREFAKLKADIAQNGVKTPISYIEHNGQKYILDGHHRARAAKELGLKDVPVQDVQLPFKAYNTIDDVLMGGW